MLRVGGGSFFGELFPLMGSLSMLISFSADFEFDEFEEGGDLDRI